MLLNFLWQTSRRKKEGQGEGTNRVKVKIIALLPYFKSVLDP